MGLLTYIEVELDKMHCWNCETLTLARKGENKATALRLHLTNEMLDKNIYIEFEKANGKKVKSEKIIVDPEAKTATLEITNQLTDVVGKIKAEIVLKDDNNLIWRSYEKSYNIIDSIGAENELEEEKIDWFMAMEKRVQELEKIVEELQNNSGGSVEVQATAEQIEELITTGNVDVSTGDLLITMPDSLNIEFYSNEDGEVLVNENYSNIEFSINENDLGVSY